MFGTNTAVSKGLDKCFSRDTGIYGTLEDLPLAWQQGHHRRAEILASLNIGRVEDLVCVDFGCGSWGFAGIYPKLHACKFAYALDISETALKQSESLTTGSGLAHRDRCKYMLSDGIDLPFPDSSVDLIYAGEAIEHVKFPKRFLAECYRTLKPDGQLIITTPNRDALLYRIQDDIYCNWVEHLWLLSWPELQQAVSEFFDIEEAIGFNGSIYRDLDSSAADSEAAGIWSRLFADRPDLGTGIVVRAVKRRSGITSRYSLNPIPSKAIRVTGKNQILDTAFGLTGTMMDSPGASVTFNCPAGADGLVIVLWSHAWSGFAGISVGPRKEERNLWAKDPGWRPIDYPLDRNRSTEVSIRAAGHGDKRTLSQQVIFCEAFTYIERLSAGLH